MSLLRSKSDRVFFSDNGVLSDITEKMRTWGEPNSSLTWVAAQDAVYVGREHKFNNRYVSIPTGTSTNATMTAAYWNGTAFVSFTDLIDETSGLSTSGWIQWEEVPAWKKDDVSNVAGLTAQTFKQQLYWVKITLSANPTSAIPIEAIKFLLSDDRLMGVIHPEVFQYLPEGQTDFLKQHELAKEWIVNTLITNGQIAYEEQIKNPEDWMLAASYKCVALILAPIPGDERLTQVKEDMEKQAKEALRLSAASLDLNKNEVLDTSEKDPGFIGSIRMIRR